jgi:hypothetical protein
MQTPTHHLEDVTQRIILVDLLDLDLIQITVSTKSKGHSLGKRCPIIRPEVDSDSPRCL